MTRYLKIRAFDMSKIAVLEKFSSFSEFWTPKIIGELNGQYVKLAKLKDDFVWHKHDGEDELFMVWKGTMTMEFRDKTEIVREGEIIIVPRGIEHCPRVDKGEAWVMLFEPKATLHTGDVMHERTVTNFEWI